MSEFSTPVEKHTHLNDDLHTENSAQKISIALLLLVTIPHVQMTGDWMDEKMLQANRTSEWHFNFLTKPVKKRVGKNKTYSGQSITVCMKYNVVVLSKRVLYWSLLCEFEKWSAFILYCCVFGKGRCVHYYDYYNYVVWVGVLIIMIIILLKWYLWFGVLNCM